MTGKRITAFTPGDELYIPHLLERGVKQIATVINEAIPGGDAGTWGLLVTYAGNANLMVWHNDDEEIEMPAPAGGAASPTLMGQAYKQCITAIPGLATLGGIDFSNDPHDYYMTGVWRDDTTGQLYYGDECGCCSDPFYGFARADLTACTTLELITHLTQRLGRSDIKQDSAAWVDTAKEVADLAGLIHQR